MSSNDKNSKGDGGSGGSDDIIGGNKEKVTPGPAPKLSTIPFSLRLGNISIDNLTG